MRARSAEADRFEADAGGLPGALGALEDHRAAHPDQVAAVGQLEGERQRGARQVARPATALELHAGLAEILRERQRGLAAEPSSAPRPRTAHRVGPPTLCWRVPTLTHRGDYRARKSRSKNIVVRLLAGERAADLGEQVVDLERLGHVEAGPDVDALDHAARIGLRGQEDDRDLLRLAVVP